MKVVYIILALTLAANSNGKYLRKLDTTIDTPHTLHMKDLPAMALTTSPDNTFCQPATIDDSHLEILCPKGFYCDSSDDSVASFLPCTQGFYCPEGSTKPSPCPSNDGKTYFTGALASNVTDCIEVSSTDYKAQIEQSSPLERDLLMKALIYIPKVGAYISAGVAMFLWPDPTDLKYAEKGLNALHDWTVEYINDVESDVCIQRIKNDYLSMAQHVHDYQVLNDGEEKRTKLSQLQFFLQGVLTAIMNPSLCSLEAQAPYFVSFATTHLTYLREVHLNYLLADTLPVNKPQHLQALKDAIKMYTDFADHMKSQLLQRRNDAFALNFHYEMIGGRWHDNGARFHCEYNDLWAVEDGGLGRKELNYGSESLSASERRSMAYYEDKQESNLQTLMSLPTYKREHDDCVSRSFDKVKTTTVDKFYKGITDSMMMSELWSSFDPTTIDTVNTRYGLLPCTSTPSLLSIGDDCTGGYQCLSKYCTFNSETDLSGKCVNQM